MVFANMFGQTADRIFELPPHQLGTVTVWLGLILYSFQIYYDFSGYSDMAIGLGRMFGFTYRENFNLSLSVHLRQRILEAVAYFPFHLV